jgi:hypothetical protein
MRGTARRASCMAHATAYNCGPSPVRAPQVRRESLLTLTALVDVIAPPEPGAGRPGSGASASATPSGALEALAALRPRLLEAVDSTRHDAVPAVRAASAEARAATLRLPGPPVGSPGAPADGSAPQAALRRSPLRKPAAVGGGAAAAGEGPGLSVRMPPPAFRRPPPPPGDFLDFGVQVFAPPSPPPRARRDSPAPGGDVSPARASDQDAAGLYCCYPEPDHVGPTLRRSMDVASQTGGPDWGSPGADAAGSPFGLQQALQSGAEALLVPPGSPGACGSPGWGMDHRFTGRVEIVVGSPAEVEAAAEQQRLRSAAAAAAGSFLGAGSAYSGSPHSPYRGPGAHAPGSRDGSPLRPRAAARPGVAPEPPPSLGSPVADVVARVLQRVLPAGGAGGLGVSPETQDDLLRLGQAVLGAPGELGQEPPPPTAVQRARSPFADAAADAGALAAHAAGFPGDHPGDGPVTSGSLAASRASSRASLAGALRAVRQASSRIGGLLEELSVGAGIGAGPVAVPIIDAGAGAGACSGGSGGSGGLGGGPEEQEEPLQQQTCTPYAAGPGSPGLAAAIETALPQLHNTLGLLQQPQGVVDDAHGLPQAAPGGASPRVPSPSSRSPSRSASRALSHCSPSRSRSPSPSPSPGPSRSPSRSQSQWPAEQSGYDQVEANQWQQHSEALTAAAATQPGEPCGRTHQRRHWQRWEKPQQAPEPAQQLPPPLAQQQPPGVRVSVQRHEQRYSLPPQSPTPLQQPPLPQQQLQQQPGAWHTADGKGAWDYEAGHAPRRADSQHSPYADRAPAYDAPGPGMDPAAHTAAAAAAPAAWKGGGARAESSESADLLMALSWRLQRLARGFGATSAGAEEAPEEVSTPSPSMRRAHGPPRFPAAAAAAAGGRSPSQMAGATPDAAARLAAQRWWPSHEEDERLAQQVRAC